MDSSPKSPVIFLIFSLFAASLPLRAAGTGVSRPSMPETLDHKTIHGQYNEGDFESVVSALETFMLRNRTYSLVDSVFIAKHLAVVYTANPSTREKGRYYMHRLLELLPSAKLVDMYVSEEIDRIFDKVREEFLARQRSFGADTARMALPERAPVRETPPPQSGRQEAREKGKAGFWIAGGAAAALAGGAAAYLIHRNEKAPGATHWNVPATVTGR